MAFSSFSSPIFQRLADVRRELGRHNLHGFVIPRSDEFQNEYVPPSAERLAWITGFTGSAGYAVVTREKAVIFVDGRYTLQAREEVSAEAFDYRDLTETAFEDWIKNNLKAGQKLGYDPWLHPHAWVQKTEALVRKSDAELVGVSVNIVDTVWDDRPSPPQGAISPHPLEYTGLSSREKRIERSHFLAREGLYAAILTQPDSLAWLLNVRGQDVPHAPLPLSFGILYATGEVDWFVDSAKVTPQLMDSLGEGVRAFSPHVFVKALEGLGHEKRRVRIDPQTAASVVIKTLLDAGAHLDFGSDPCVLPKACKNPTEVSGARNAHLRDGVAVTKFLAWLHQQHPIENVTELSASEALLNFRRQDPMFRDASFETIAGAGPHGAIVHYRSTPKTNQALDANNLLLVDSGAQYPDGTTDITRTISIGAPTDEMRDRFTRVLKGHIAIASVRFPQGTTGAQLDVLARQYLWQEGLDYDHGTGHGVGSYLSVHEGPQRISKAPSAVPLQPGMILSNEPGYYKAGAYGIRIESLVVVRPCANLQNTERPLLEFETLTLAPIDLSLVATHLMSAAERTWLNDYHQRVRETLSPLLPDDVVDWLKKATEPLI